MDRREPETALGRQLHRCLHVIDRKKGDPVGAVEHEGHLAIKHTGLQVDYLVCAEPQQLLKGHLAQRAELSWR